MKEGVSNNWVFPAKVNRVVDGDTIDCYCDLGFRAYAMARVRLARVDTAEVYGQDRDSAEYELGSEQSRFVRDWVAKGAASGEEWPFILITEKKSGKYGRWIGDIRRKFDGSYLSFAIADEWPESEILA